MNISRHLMLAVLLTLSVHAVSSECLLGDCKNGVGQLALNNGAFVTSQFKDGHTHGYGVTTYANGTVCEGYSRKGVWHGLRHCFWENTGSRFYGNYNAGKRSAEALYIDRDGNIKAEGFYYRGELQRSYEIDRARLLERFLEMRATADQIITKLIPPYMKVFYIPSPKQAKLTVKPMEAPSLVKTKPAQKKIQPAASERLQVGSSDADGEPRGDVFAPSSLNRSRELAETPNKANEPAKTKVDDATKWALEICEQEGFEVGSTQFGVCVAKMREVY